MDQISVLVRTYKGDDPDGLAASIDSLLAQTRLPDEIVVVEDGPLTEPLEETLATLEREAVVPIERVAHAENQGNGAACRTGIEAATSDLVAIQDADDLAVPQRSSGHSSCCARPVPISSVAISRSSRPIPSGHTAVGQCRVSRRRSARVRNFATRSITRQFWRAGSRFWTLATIGNCGWVKTTNSGRGCWRRAIRSLTVRGCWRKCGQAHRCTGDVVDSHTSMASSISSGGWQRLALSHARGRQPTSSCDQHQKWHRTPFADGLFRRSCATNSQLRASTSRGSSPPPAASVC